MPVTTLSDLKERRTFLAEGIAWAKREERVAATQYERDRASERLPELTSEYALVCEEIRQGESQRRTSLKTFGKRAFVVLVAVGIIGALV